MANELTVASLGSFLSKHRETFAVALPKHLNADRMVRLAMTAFSTNKTLRDCDAGSIFGAVVIASQMGLEIGVGGQGYLVPYKGRATFVPGWQGMVDLAQRSGRSSCWTGAVFEGDEFDYELGAEPFVKHKPAGEDNPQKMTHVYAIGRVKDAPAPIIDVWPMLKVIKHRDRFNKVGAQHYSYQHLEMYARKVVLLQVLKYLPKSIELSNAIVAENAYEIGTPVKVVDNQVVMDVPDDTAGTKQQADPAKVYKTTPRRKSEQTTPPAAAVPATQSSQPEASAAGGPDGDPGADAPY